MRDGALPVYDLWAAACDATDRSATAGRPPDDTFAEDRVAGAAGAVRRGGQCRMLTARAITRSEVSRAETLWMLINSFARVDRGIVSVGLNAVEFVTET